MPRWRRQIAQVRAPHDEDAGARRSAAPRRCSTAAATSTARSTTDLRRAARRARRRDRAVAGLPLGQLAAARAGHHREDIYNATAITYPAVYRMTMTGARLKEILEDVADNLFNPDPYYQQGGDMVRVGGARLHDRRRQADGQPHLRPDACCKTGKPLEAARDYTVAGWASVNEGTEGPPIWDVVDDASSRRRRPSASKPNTSRESRRASEQSCRTYANCD